MIKLLVIDDHFLIHEGLAKSLETEGFLVKGVYDVDEAIETKSDEVDIILLDLYIKDKDPITNFKFLKIAFPETPVAILTQEESIAWKAKMFQCGAKGYFLKSESKPSIISRLKLIAQGYDIVPSGIANYLDNEGSRPTEKISGSWDILIRLIRGMEVKEIAIEMQQSLSSIEKKIKKIKEMYKLKTNCQMIYHFFIKKDYHRY